MRIAGSATGVLTGIYLASPSAAGIHSGAALAGTLGAVAFAAELAGAIPMGMASDATAPRKLMTAGAVLAAAATQLFGMTGRVGIFFLSRSVEGLGAAAGTPSLLAHLTDVTEGDSVLRAQVMSWFEISLLAGLALGGIFASESWHWLGVRAFSVVAGGYLAAALLLFFGASGSHGYGAKAAIGGFGRALRQPSLRRLAPIWLCVNTIVGIWLGPTLPFLLTDRPFKHQYLAGIFRSDQGSIGWVLLVYSLIFAAGVTIWSRILPRIPIRRTLSISLVAMFGASAGLYTLNHSASVSPAIRWSIVAVTSLIVMVESGFTPAALTLVAGAAGARAGRGAAMGVYSVLLSLGAIIGSLLAGWLGGILAVDGLIYATAAMAAVALMLLWSFDVE